MTKSYERRVFFHLMPKARIQAFDFYLEKQELLHLNLLEYLRSFRDLVIEFGWGPINSSEPTGLAILDYLRPCKDIRSTLGDGIIIRILSFELINVMILWVDMIISNTSK